MSGFTFDRWVLGATGLTALLVTAAVIEYQNTKRLNDDAALVERTHQVIDTLQEMAIQLYDSQAIQRTYLLAEDEGLYPKLASNIADVKSMLRNLKTLTADNRDQRNRIPGLENQIDALADYWFETARVRKAEGLDAAKRMIQRGRTTAAMADLEILLRQMELSERTLLQDRAARTAHTYRSALWTGSLMSVVAVAGVVAFIVLLKKHLAARNAAAIEVATQAREASRRKDEFLATVAHELRNPLAPILNAVQVLRMIDLAEPEIPELRDMIERQVMHMIRLVDDLLEVNRIARGKIEVQKDRVNLLNAVRDAVEASGPVIESKRHELTLDLPQQPIQVVGDRVRLTQVVTNLLNNAAHYTPEGGHIWLTVETGCDEAIIRVRDNGLGIPPERLLQVFDLFTQIHGRQGGGLGIGLALVKQLVEIHGGSVEAHSEGIRKGTEFEVRLPLVDAEASEGEPKKAIEHVGGVFSHRILVVDDNEDAAKSVSLLLSAVGHEVQTAYDGRSGVRLAKQLRPEIVFLDLGMPGMDGFETARELRKLQSDVKLIALTGWGQDANRQRLEQAGFDGHLVKPATLSALDEQIAHMET